jgi:cytochrome c oxidase subunit IV
MTENVRGYLITWLLLLAVTIVMLVLDGAGITRAGLLTVLLGAMTVKAVLIAGTFMHLRRERAGLVLTVVAGLFVVGMILYGLIVPDAIRIQQMTESP